MTSPHAPSAMKVFVCAASLRADSLNQKLAALAARVAAATGATVDLASMREFDVPIFDGDLEAAQGIPDGAAAFQRRLIASDAFIVTKSPSRCAAASICAAVGRGSTLIGISRTREAYRAVAISPDFSPQTCSPTPNSRPGLQ